MHYAYFDCLLVRSSFICNPVNETTPTSLEEEEQILLAPSQEPIKILLAFVCVVHPGKWEV